MRINITVTLENLFITTVSNISFRRLHSEHLIFNMRSHIPLVVCSYVNTFDANICKDCRTGNVWKKKKPKPSCRLIGEIVNKLTFWNFLIRHIGNLNRACKWKQTTQTKMSNSNGFFVVKHTKNGGETFVGICYTSWEVNWSWNEFNFPGFASIFWTISFFFND